MLVSFHLKLTCLFTQSANLQSLGQVSKSLETIYSSHRSSGHEADAHWPADFISHASIFVLQENYLFCFSAFHCDFSQSYSVHEEHMHSVHGLRRVVDCIYATS